MESQDQEFNRFVGKIKSYTTIDLSQYKEAQMKRRLTTLRIKKGFSSFDAYFEAIVKDKQLLYEFLDRMTINVSEFWRNPNRWQVLEERILPQLTAVNRRLRVWSAACSTGEEPYTLAMILQGHGLLRDASLLATDLDEGVLEKAQQGVYLDRSIRDVPPVQLEKNFIKEGEVFRVNPELKRYVRFQKQNLLTDRFENNFDLIVCRNVMIYFTEEAKHELYQKFSAALRPGGILFVGSTEQIFSPNRYGMELADTFFYRKL
ncbi:CheR family methyltransferase [Gorillibacterium massiliense]|uniref:CheR family methyltransferase n=1 Tax=Gorillibacterium massiliense TaxID=1280390 RepID=UPI0005939A34|nr:protein-glutamate O-methyltransferase CheR [Gorillibacterium massiliense]